MRNPNGPDVWKSLVDQREEECGYECQTRQRRSGEVREAEEHRRYKRTQSERSNEAPGIADDEILKNKLLRHAEQWIEPADQPESWWHGDVPSNQADDEQYCGSRWLREVSFEPTEEHAIAPTNASCRQTRQVRL
jgi:hypothetical protein